MNNKEILITALMIVIGTAFLRFLPFFIINKSLSENKYVQFLGRILPYSMIALLVIYCIKDINIIKFPYGLPEIISIILVAVFQIIKRNVLISIGLGTVIYMFLVQVIFI
ncbi:branched-chain amino acid transporter permease [Brachyspira pilosicoli]|uniref:Branched-chain amino acid transporter AzlD n=1 Tax=Brachyspira pilosicoli TaxID=52584 RepID=A0A5C8FAU3_BRAPL|nr:AzlD domain-containing protein [Brachyspira pilosicoli]TXJ47066.1 branched-chain amino acid transporter AzlD [Brachyspira pilosicoli]